jgi:hypothetical protein
MPGWAVPNFGAGIFEFAYIFLKETQESIGLETGQRFFPIFYVVLPLEITQTVCSLIVCY